jgi:hypothetical protein
VSDCFGAPAKSASSPMRVLREKKQSSKVTGFNGLLAEFQLQGKNF